MSRRMSQEEHERLVRVAAGSLLERAYRDIQADVAAFPRPEKITWPHSSRGHVPDIVAFDDRMNLFEVETEDSVRDEHTEDQWRLFSDFARDNRAVFWVVVPVGVRDAARERMTKLGVKGSVWEV